MSARARRGRSGRLWLMYGVLVSVAIALAAAPGDAQRFEYALTFDRVTVQGIEGTNDTPELAHEELLGGEKSTLSTEGEDDRTKRRERPVGQAPQVSPALPVYVVPLAFAPGQGTANPSFVQEGFLVESFWAGKTGTREGFFKRAHFHPADLATGFEAQHLGNPNELHGIYIRSLDGKRFGVKSLRYRVTRNRQLPNKPLSIEGFSNFNVNVLIGRSFDPRGPNRVQFVTFPVGLPAGNDLTLPWWTLRIFGFELVDQVYIASSASVDIDDIVLTRREPPPALLKPREEDK